MFKENFDKVLVHLFAIPDGANLAWPNIREPLFVGVKELKQFVNGNLFHYIKAEKAMKVSID
jgi:hypothetical protein